MLKKIENIHIFFWLIKDLCWCLTYKSIGILLIIPTISIAIFILYKSYNIVSDFVHNFSVLCWITANSIWMITEFYNMETNFFHTHIIGKYLASFFFITGIVVLTIYYTSLTYNFFKNEIK